ncbi:MAG: hypothetical protein ACYTGG_07925 [Planctomycetota bacterium]|jgi:hypothetical protein
MNMGRKLLWNAGLAMMAVAASLWPAVALATAPPAPTLRKTAPAWMGYGVIFLLVVVVLTVSLLPSKRSHQD